MRKLAKEHRKNDKPVTQFLRKVMKGKLVLSCGHTVTFGHDSTGVVFVGDFKGRMAAICPSCSN